MPFSFAFSLILHGLIILLMVVGLPFLRREGPELVLAQPIGVISAAELPAITPMELPDLPEPDEPIEDPDLPPVPPSENLALPERDDAQFEVDAPRPDTPTLSQSLPDSRPPEESPLAQLASEPPPPEPPEPTPEPPPEPPPEPAPPPEPEPEIVPDPEPIPEPDPVEPEEPEPDPPPEATPAEPPPPTPPLPQRRPPPPQMPERPTERPAPAPEEPAPPTSEPYRLAPGDEAGVRNAIHRCWSSPPGALDVPIVEVRVTMTRDKFVQWSGGQPGSGQPLIEIINAPAVADARFNAAAAAAVRAAANPACQPWDSLPDNLWPRWQTIEFNFDPRDVR